MLWPRARPIMWAYALLIAASRVIVSVHYPTDVLGAAAFAFVSVLLIREFFAARGLLFSSDAQGNIQAMPGPAWRRVKNLLPAAGGLR
jgi:undecaprenyl-diphosphatase